VHRARTARPPVERSAFGGFRFPPEVITVAVRWYLRYSLSYRDVEELLAERGVEVDHVSGVCCIPRARVLAVGSGRGGWPGASISNRPSAL
jgi:IS6 family transposase